MVGAYFSLFHVYHNRFLQIQNQQNFTLRALRNKNVLRRYLHKKLVLQKNGDQKWRKHVLLLVQVPWPLIVPELVWPSLPS